MVERKLPRSEAFYLSDDERILRDILGPLADPFIAFIKSSPTESMTELDTLYRELIDAEVNGTLPEGLSAICIYGRALGLQMGERIWRANPASHWVKFAKQGS